MEVLLYEPTLYSEVADRITLSDFESNETFGEIAEVLFECLREGAEPEPARLYGQIESPETAALLGELESAGKQKGDPQVRLTESLKVLEDIRRKKEIEQLKHSQQEDDVTDYLRKKQQLAKKGLDRRAGSAI